MDADKFFPSTWLKAEDIGDKKQIVTIKDVREEKVGDDNKLVVGFKELDKTLVLNRTNYDRIKSELGSETDHWIQKKVELYTITTNFKGQDVQAVRLKMVQ